MNSALEEICETLDTIYHTSDTQYWSLKGFYETIELNEALPEIETVEIVKTTRKEIMSRERRRLKL